MTEHGINVICDICGWIWLTPSPPAAAAIGDSAIESVWRVVCPQCKESGVARRSKSKAQLHSALARHGFPPWLHDKNPDHWVTLDFAAKHYFHKSARRLRSCIQRGDYDDVFPTFFDGWKWRIRLPELPDVKMESGK